MVEHCLVDSHCHNRNHFKTEQINNLVIFSNFLEIKNGIHKQTESIILDVNLHENRKKKHNFH